MFTSDIRKAENKISSSDILEIDEEMQLQKDVCHMSESPNMPFKYASAGNCSEIEKLIIGNPQTVFKKDDNGMTMLHHASVFSRIEVMEVLLLYRADINAQDEIGNTAIHHAVLHNQAPALSYLILNKANPNIFNVEKLAPIHLAVYKGKTECLKELLKHQEVNKDETTRNGNNAIHIACEVDNQEALKYLLKAEVQICKPNKYGVYPIHIAIKFCNEKCLEMLVNSKKLSGITPKQILNFKDKEGDVPLHTAVNTGDPKAVQMCLSYGACINVRQNDNSTPLHYACTKGELDMVKLMLSERQEVKDCVLKMQDNNGHTPLHIAVMFNHIELTEYLIEEGSGIEIKDDNGWTPLLLAASRLNLETVKCLVNQGADIYARDNSSRNIIHLFSLNIVNDKSNVLFNLDKIQQTFVSIINEKDCFGCTPLHYSTRRGLLKLTGSLIGLGGLCMAQNNDKDTPLHFAARYGRIHTCRKFLNSFDGMKAMNSTDSKGRLPIHAAAENGHTKIIQLLLDKGCIFHRCYHGNTPLHYAASNGHIETCQYLIEINPSFLDNQNHEGKTALHVAAINDKASVVGLLLTHGASVLMDNQGLSFFTHTLKLKNLSTAKEVIANNRWEEIMLTFDNSGSTPIIGMIKDMPNIFSLAMDKSITTEGSRGQKEFKIIYNFGMLQRTVSKKEDLIYDPFYIVKTMVDLVRVDLLMHPLCTAYLKMKWERFGRWVQYLIMLLYLIYLFALSSSTYIITFFAVHHLHKQSNFSQNCTEIDVFYGHESSKKFLWIFSMVILLYSIGSLIKEAVQIISKKWSYILHFENYTSLVLHISSVILASYFVKMEINHSTMQVAAVAIFLGWFNLLLLLFHFERIGLFVIMFVQILQTVILVLSIFSILFIGFAFSFVILFKAPTDTGELSINHSFFNQCYKQYSSANLEPAIKVWQTLPSGILKSVVMMMGEIEFLNTYVTPMYDSNDSTLHYPELTVIFLLVFIIFMSLLLMNLLIGLAVGDIEAVQKDANLKRISLQVTWLSEFENKLPLKFRNWVFKEIWEVYPFRCSLEHINACDNQVIYKKNENDDYKDFNTVMDTLVIHEKQLSNLMLDSRQQTELLKLILQKMEMDPEAEISDETAPEMISLSKNWKTLIAAKSIISKFQKPVKSDKIC